MASPQSSFGLACQACTQAAQAAKKAEEAQQKPAAEGVPQLVDEVDDVDPNQYHERRLRGLLAAKAEGKNPYPHKFQVSTYLPAYVAQYSTLEAGSRLEETVSVAGETRAYYIARKAAPHCQCRESTMSSACEGCKCHDIAG